MATVDSVSDMCKKRGHTKVKVTSGATTRHRSIACGIRYLHKVQPVSEVVVIHDAVRVFVEADLLEKVVREARLHGAAGVVRPLVSTVVSMTDSGFLDKSLDRLKFRASEMPQAFRNDIINTAYLKCTDYDLDYGTECLHLAQTYGGAKVRLLDGPDYLWKVTQRKDLYALEGMLKDQRLNHPVGLYGLSAQSPLATQLASQLKALNIQMECIHDYDLPPVYHRLVIFVQDCAELESLKFLDSGSDVSSVTMATILLDCRLKTGGVLNMFGELRQWIEKMSGDIESSKQPSLHGIIIQKDQPGRAAEIVCSIIREQRICLSGQVFMV